jgi:hypothetical protein
VNEGNWIDGSLPDSSMDREAITIVKKR